MLKCKICGAKTNRIISFGKMPIANAFTKKPSQKEFIFNLELQFCPTCYMVQLGETVPPEKMFHDHYQFFSSTSKSMEQHFKEQATHILDMTKKINDPFIVEIGSNDGIMLKHIAQAKIRHLGIEPSKNVAKISKTVGVNALSIFFNARNAFEIEKKYGKADIICGSNVICHIENINSVFEGVAKLISNDGYFFFEEPYIYDIIKSNSFDQIYDEHVFYYSGLSVSKLASRHGLKLVDMQHQSVHGGSMRYYIKKGKDSKVKASVKKYIDREKKLKLNKLKGYIDFEKRIKTVCTDLLNLLHDLKSKGHTIAGYAATSKSTTFLNYAGIGNDIIEYISDTTPTKVGLYTPGSGIPVKSYQHFLKCKPEYAVLFAYNHKKEIFMKEVDYMKNGGKFITYFPKISIK